MGTGSLYSFTWHSTSLFTPGMVRYVSIPIPYNYYVLHAGKTCLSSLHPRNIKYHGNYCSASAAGPPLFFDRPWALPNREWRL